MKLILLLTAIAAPILGHSQLSRSSYVDIHIDKTLCYPGDTVRFSGYAIKDRETNLYCELYADDSILASRSTFPLISNRSEGSIVVPKRSGYYWLTFHTFNSKLTVFPLSVMADSKVLVSKKFSIPQNNRKIISYKEVGDSLEVRIEDTTRHFSSVSITDSKIPISGPSFLNSNTDFKFPESNFIEYSGSILGNNRKHKPIRNEDLVTVFSKDSNTKILLTPIDTFGNFRIKNLYFTDTAYISYQLNLPDNDLKDIVMNLKSKQFPVFIPPANFEYDTISYIPKLVIPDFNATKYLTTVTVHAKWQDRNKGLDKRYTTGIYSIINSPFNYNMMDSNVVNKWTYDIGSFLKFNVPNNPMNLKPGQDFDLTGYKVYIDEMEIDTQIAQEMVHSLNVHTEVAYVKIIEDMTDNRGNPTKYLCIYKRKDKDLRGVPGKMNRIPVVGYTKYLEFTQSDRITYLWIPSVRENVFKIKKYVGTLTIQGIDEHGSSYFYRTEIK
jgi:hypothetical protein